MQAPKKAAGRPRLPEHMRRKMVCIRLTDEVRSKLEALATCRGTSKTMIVERLVKDEYRGAFETKEVRYAAYCMRGHELFGSANRRQTMAFIRSAKSCDTCGELVCADMTVVGIDGERKSKFVGHIGCDCCEQPAAGKQR